MQEFIKALEELQIEISIAQIQAEEALASVKKLSDKVENLHIIYLEGKNK